MKQRRLRKLARLDDLQLLASDWPQLAHENRSLDHWQQQAWWWEMRKERWPYFQSRSFVDQVTWSHVNASRRDFTSTTSVMLLIARILILFFITMAVIRCPGCKKTFETNGGLSSHRRFCKTQINAFAKQILDQHHAVEEPHTKRPRFGKNRVVIGKGKEREEELETTAVNKSDNVR